MKTDPSATAPATEALSRFDQLRKLTEVSRALTYTTGLDQIMRLATARAAELLNGDRGVLMLLDASGLLQVRSTFGVDSESARRFREPLDETLGSRVQTLLGVSENDRFIGVPLVAGGSVKGLLGIVRPGTGPCREEEEWMLSAVADQVAVAMENARLESEIVRARRGGARATDAAGDAGVDKDRALATLSHDLRSPLNAIDSYAELMAMEILGAVTDRQREALGRIRMSGRHLLAVLQNVLEMGRLESGTIHVHPTSVDLVKVAEEAVFMVRHTATARGQQLTIQDGEPVLTMADADRIRQVLVNLINNAIKYTPAEGTITVSIYRKEHAGANRAMISVEDDGPGIAEADLESIFQPYVRLERPDGESTEGGRARARHLPRTRAAHGRRSRREERPARGLHLHRPPPPRLTTDDRRLTADS